jgi:hypothetical protein
MRSRGVAIKHDITLDRLTEDELIVLNRRVVERLRFLRQPRCYEKMLAAAEKVGFKVVGRPVITRTGAMLLEKALHDN